MRILIVDDSRSVHSYTKSCLKAIGISDFIDAFSGDEALKILNDSIDLILLDWEMPIKNGPETLKEVRARGLDVPIIVVTSKDCLSDISFMLDLGANDYMTKPFTAEVLKEKIDSLKSLIKHP